MKKKWIIIGAALAVIVGLGASGFLLLPRLLGGGGQGDDLGFNEAALDVGGVPVEVELGEVESLMVLDATVQAEPGEDVKARNGGTVTHLWVTNGSLVDNGAPIVNVAVADETAGSDSDSDGDAAPRTREITLYASAEGRVSGMDDIQVGDVLEAGAVAATVAPEEFRAVASIPANDLYRFYEDPGDIMLQITQGPPAAECEFLSLDASAKGGDSGGGDEEGGGSGGGGSELACRVPADLEVFDGVTGKLSISTGGAQNVMVVPVTSVRGTSQRGEVIVVAGDGAEEVREVKLGVSDGSSVEVVSGLSVGDMVLDPIPLDPRFDVPGAVEPEDDFDDEFFELEEYDEAVEE